MARVEMIDICNDYDGLEVMAYLNLRVGDGEFVELVGLRAAARARFSG